MKKKEKQRLEEATREELYEKAREKEIPRRSSMTKAELARALRGSDGEESVGAAHASESTARTEHLRHLAERRADGELLVPPRMLTGNDRRLHVRRTLREDHRRRISRRVEDAKVKFDELSDSLFSFFRGTALLFYRDMAGEDAERPIVLALGDVHPENFGVMPNAHDVPIFGVNDFDEATYAPFTWDLKRGAVGFMIAVREIAGKGRKKQWKIARRFLRGYVDGIRRFAEHSTERSHELRVDNAPKLIRRLIEDAKQERGDWLRDDYLDASGRGFRSDDELVPLSDRRDEFQEIIDRLVEENGIEPPPRAGDMKVKDVAIRRGQGTASLGLDRYYVMIEGPRSDGTDDLILELKRARASAMEGLAPTLEDVDFGAPGERIAHAQAAQLVRGDLFYGNVDIDGISFMSRERAPYRDDLDLDDLSKKKWKKYASICGECLAHAHALSDEIGAIEVDIEPRIVKSIGPRDLFVDDILRYAAEATERVVRDHEAFRADHALGAFETLGFVSI